MKDGEVAQRILPNVEFDSIAEGCINTSYCVIKEKGKVVHILAPGAITPVTIKDLPRLDGLSVSELKEMARNEGISFPSKATKAKLLELLEG